MPNENTGNIVTQAPWTTTTTDLKTGKVTPGFGEVVGKVYSKQRTSTASVGYPRVLNKGNPFTFIEQTEIRPNGVRSSVSLGATSRTVQSGGFLYTDGRTAITLQPAYTAAERSRLDAELRTKIRLEIKDQKVNFAVAAAEWQRTSDMVAKAATAIYKAYTDLRRGDIVGAAGRFGVSVPKRARRRFSRGYARDQSDAIARGWLELQYGWKPLLGDVRGAAEYAAQQSIPSVTSRISRKAKLKKTTETSSEGATGVNQFTNYETKESELDIKYVVWFTLNASLAHNASQTGVLNPLAVAWELVPFSFVIDWFLPIGDMLSSLDATAGLGFAGGCITTFERLNAEKFRIVTGPNTQENTSWSRQYVRCDRVKLTAFPDVARPYFKNPVSVTHALNALALLQTLRK